VSKSAEIVGSNVPIKKIAAKIRGHRAWLGNVRTVDPGRCLSARDDRVVCGEIASLHNALAQLDSVAAARLTLAGHCCRILFIAQSECFTISIVTGIASRPSPSAPPSAPAAAPAAASAAPAAAAATTTTTTTTMVGTAYYCTGIAAFTTAFRVKPSANGRKQLLVAMLLLAWVQVWFNRMYTWSYSTCQTEW
jgi:hypothetical protein